MAIAGSDEIVGGSVAELKKRIDKVDNRSRQLGKRLGKLSRRIKSISKREGPAGPRGPRGKMGPAGPAGPQGPSGVSGLEPFRVSVPFGSSAVLVQNGMLTLTAQCLEDTTDNAGNPAQDVARVLISTSGGGAVFDSGEDSKPGTNSNNFLYNDTPESDRVFAEDGVAHGLAELDRGADEGAALDPNGKGLILAENGIAFAHGLYGDDCNFTGIVQKTG
jgi:hypothetical protein